MKSWFLRLIAVFMAFVLCVAISACGKDDAGEEKLFGAWPNRIGRSR